MTYATAQQIDASEIPVIDMAPLVDGGDEMAVAREIHRAVTGIGFLYVRNHGVPDAVIESTRAGAARFFALPTAEKDRVGMVRYHRGFLKMGVSQMPGAKSVDYKESFIWGAEVPPDGFRPGESDPLRAPNIWPDDLPGFREAVFPWLEQAEVCAKRLMGAFAVALGRPRDAFLKTAERGVSRASIIYYPPQPPKLGETQFGVGPHTDFGCLTLLCQDDVGGLQVQNLAGDWLTAHPIPGTIVVNVGDLLAQWSNDRFRSTPHRVVNSSGRARYSLVLAYDPDSETVIDPADFLPEGETPHYRPTTCGAHVAGRFGESFSYER